ncbi:hypothetical protein TrLO_g11041 [Triparma laevis f. longispina]|uniref:Uncharacterized protein n=1 Tax=Triparma laevis f. longispina TaxID=1714387 RepID=A0A9W7CM98_9STRA|nr:hypothetical protein TrLO_g11041 [Triparma laevis f. longispina]
MNTVRKSQLCESDDSTDYEATVEAKLRLFRAKRKSSLLVYTVINKVEEFMEDKASNDQSAELVKTICDSVKATLLATKSDVDFMGSKDMSAFKSLADTILKASRFIYEYVHKHWFLRYSLAPAYKKTLKEFTKKLMVSMQCLALQYSVYSQHSSKQQREEHFASIIAVSDKDGMKTAMDKVQADTKKHKENLVLLQTMMKVLEIEGNHQGDVKEKRKVHTDSEAKLKAAKEDLKELSELRNKR